MLQGRKLVLPDAAYSRHTASETRAKQGGTLLAQFANCLSAATHSVSCQRSLLHRQRLMQPQHQQYISAGAQQLDFEHTQTLSRRTLVTKALDASRPRKTSAESVTPACLTGLPSTAQYSSSSWCVVMVTSDVG